MHELQSNARSFIRRGAHEACRDVLGILDLFNDDRKRNNTANAHKDHSMPVVCFICVPYLPA